MFALSYGLVRERRKINRACKSLHQKPGNDQRESKRLIRHSEKCKTNLTTQLEHMDNWYPMKINILILS